MARDGGEFIDSIESVEPGDDRAASVAMLLDGVRAVVGSGVDSPFGFAPALDMKTPNRLAGLIPMLAALTLALVAAIVGLAPAGAEGVPPPPTRWATDTAGFLAPETVARLDADLEQFERRTGHSVLLWIGRTTGGVPIEDFAAQTFQAWRVGRKGIDDGLVLFVFADDRRLRIEVGYGLEDRMTDIRSGRIIRDVITPRLQAGDRDGGIAAGVAAIESTIEAAATEGGGSAAGGQAAADAAPLAPSTPTERRVPGLSLAEKIVLSIVALAFLVLVITNPSLAFWLLIQILSSGRGGGGGGGGGGGWSGGGGRSGGGGASGSW